MKAGFQIMAIRFPEKIEHYRVKIRNKEVLSGRHFHSEMLYDDS